jgi:hypothetical protein
MLWAYDYQKNGRMAMREKILDSMSIQRAAPGGSMNLGVLRFCHQIQVFDSIVFFVTILVMTNLILSKFSPYSFFHKESMFSFVNMIYVNNNISLAYRLPPFPVVMFFFLVPWVGNVCVTLTRAKETLFGFKMDRKPIDFFAAVVTWFKSASKMQSTCMASQELFRTSFFVEGWQFLATVTSAFNKHNRHIKVSLGECQP